MSTCTGCKHDVRHSCGCNHPLAITSAFAADGDLCRLRSYDPEDTDGLRAEAAAIRSAQRYADMDRADRMPPR